MIPKFHQKILTALVEAGGQMSCEDLKKLYGGGRGNGVRHSTMINHGLTEWVRPRFNENATAVRITELGRTAHLAGHRE